MTAKAITAFGPSFGGDGGFWTIGPDGKLHWVPPWDPEIMRDMGLASNLAALATGIRDTALRAQVISVAQSIASVHAKAIQEQAKSATH